MEQDKSHSYSNKPSSNTGEKNKKTDNYTSLPVPQITLPKGGGSIRSIDEKFSVNAANGTSGCSFAFPFSTSRNGFMPAMALSYSSGAGNGIFGLGWNAEPPSITRRTDKKLPQYQDDIESDVFIFSGAEDLVPVFNRDASGNWIKDSNTINGAIVSRYRPRIESGFARIEKIKEANGNIYWKVTSSSNVVSVFGKSKTAQLYDPADPTRIFKWFFEFSYDDKGNCFQFEYKREDKVNVPDELHEKNRLNDFSVFTNTYLKRIKYCNKVHFNRSGIDLVNWENFLSNIQYLLELVLDYGEHDINNPQPNDDKGWPCRTDAFSEYRSGFEIRTYRLCRRILMFHKFSELGTTPCLVSSINIEYDAGSVFTFLKSITQKGYIRKQDGSYSSKSLPPVEFTYEKLGWNTEIKSLSKDSLENLPTGIDDRYYQWIDLYKEGVPGILTEQATGWFYKNNSGDGKFDGTQLVSPKPSLNGVSTGLLHFADIEAKGQQFLVDGLNGYYELNDDNQWLPFKNFTNVPNIDLRDPHLKMLDLDGDGMADILVSEDEVFTWYASKGKEGFEQYQSVRKIFDEEKGPNIVFADGTQSIVLADMSGDGLMDIVRIRFSEVCYWPNLGYGKFGAKVNMSNAPFFDIAENFNPHFVKLADLDGSGTTDIVYLGHDSFKIYFNQNGNSWSEVNIINGVNPLPFPKIDTYSDVTIIDLLGSGTGCIVWSSSLPQHTEQPLQYIDLMGGKKPHILTSYKNNMGKEVFVEYKPSTFFYLQDKKAGTPWITKLPFPVHCVSQAVMIDQIRKSRFTNQYSYHHGYYDQHEREFRGFGRVDQTDTEDFENFKKHSDPGGVIQLVDEGFHQPPALTKTWFHTGAFLDKEKIFTQFAHEYYSNNVIPEKVLADPALPNDTTVHEWREALRACKGLPLRSEVYSLDGSDKQQHPYTTSNHSCLIQLLQPKLQNANAVFMVQESESLVYTYERNPADPRIVHGMTIETDAFGNVLKSAATNYGRKTTDASLTAAEQAEQSKTHIVFSQNNFTNKIDTSQDYHLPVGYESLSFELTGLTPSVGDYFSIADISTDFDQAVTIDYHILPTPGRKEKRLIEQVCTRFLKNDLSSTLPLGVIESLVLPHQSARLSMTPGLRDFIYGNKVTDILLMSEGKYVHFNDGNYWIASVIQKFDANNFFQVIEMTDPFGFKAKIEYDSNYRFFVQKTIDALNNESSVLGFNYRTLSPYLLKDTNDNRGGVRTDELGMVISSFAMGKANENKGDLMDIAAVEASLNDRPSALLEYDLFNYKNTGKPNFVKTTAFETHYHDSIQTGVASKSQVSYAYAEGGGGIIMKKVQAEPGLALQENPDGSVNEVNTRNELRWIGNGRTILNNKGKAVKQYEPYFSTTFEFEDAKLLVERGVTPVITYDSAGRAIRTDLPDGTFIKVEFDSWMQRSFDQNDTVLESQWYKDRIISPVTAIATPEEVDAANKTAAHANTPAVVYLDSLGRNFLAIADNGAAGKFKTTSQTDVEGNTRSVTDARGNVVMQYKYDMLGAQLYSTSIDAGERWLINDVMGKPLRGFDSRNHVLRYEYDNLHRPLKVFLQDNNAAEVLTEKIIYGEGITNDKQLNLRGKPYQIYDTAGIVTNTENDFKGNPLRGSRQLCNEYKSTIDWNSNPLLATEIFINSSTFDALNRPLQMQTPDSSIVRPVYNEAGILNEVYIRIKGMPETQFVKNINYDAKGQRQSISYGNNTKTNYQYDPKTLRLTQLLTTGSNGTDILQKLHYTYDPAGNITTIKDEAQQTIYFNNAVVNPSNQYTYDAIYRLISATGREHIGQNQSPSSKDEFRTNLPMPGDGSAMRNYTQQYEYDAVDNILRMIHAAGAGSWTRSYVYETTNNSLKSNTVNTITENYTYDEHGNIQSLSHLSSLRWNFKDQLQQANLGGGGIAYYVYDGSGQRIRKIIERLDGSKEERIYLGGFEVYKRTDNGSVVQEQTETLHVMDDSRRIAIVETKTVKDAVSVTTGSWQPLIRYQYSNHLGSSSLELDENATIISYEEYHPFGTTSYQAKNANIIAAAKRYRYTGMERDEESGLEYHSARYYLPWLGRWLNADPIGIKGGINLYAYAGNNPVHRTDTKGTDWKEDIFGDMKKAQVTTTDYGAITAKGRLIAFDKQGHPGDRIFVPFGKDKPTYIHTQKNWFKITSIEGDKVNYESVDKPSGVWIRISGLGEMIAGALGSAGGVAFGVATAETGVGPVAGAAFSTWSADHAIRGARNFWNGQEHRTFTANILSNVMSDRAADATDDIAYFIASMAISYGNAKLPSTKLPPASSGRAVFGDSLSSNAVHGKPQLGLGWLQKRARALGNRAKLVGQHELPPGAAGVTNADGTMMVLRGMPREWELVARGHEGGHSLLTATKGPFLKLRQGMSDWLYKKSNLMRGLEEFLVHSMSTGSWSEGLAHIERYGFIAAPDGYGMSHLGLRLEIAGVGIANMVLAYGGYKLSTSWPGDD
jgi:RHS repeat-associated protein